MLKTFYKRVVVLPTGFMTTKPYDRGYWIQAGVVRHLVDAHIIYHGTSVGVILVHFTRTRRTYLGETYDQQHEK